MKNGWIWISVLMVSMVMSMVLLVQVEESIIFEVGNGEMVEVFWGFFEVFENCMDLDSCMIIIGYVCFLFICDNLGDLIVYFVGGLGGIGMGMVCGQCFLLFMVMCEYGDVIVYDQCGIGLLENDLLCCQFSFGGDDLVC